jgi:hypothetical protein
MIKPKVLFLGILLLVTWMNSFVIAGTMHDNESSAPSDTTTENSLNKEVEIILFTDSIAADTALLAPLVIQKTPIVYPPATRDYRKLGINTSLFVGVTFVSFGILWVLPESFTNWDKEEIMEEGLFNKWKKNVKAGPVIDSDNFFLNWITHPYAGAVYYMSARSCGFKSYECILYTTFMSTFFWEYGVEAFAEVPSWQDIIITPTVGSVFGEGFYYAKKEIMKHDKRILKSKFLGVTSLILMDPFNTLTDALGYKQKVKSQINVSPVGFNKQTNQPIWGVTFSANF